MGNINIAEILRNSPKGTKLYRPIFGDVYLDKIRPHLATVVTTDKEQGDFKEEFLYDGRYGMNGECMLFPSKENRDWNAFEISFNDGDIVSTEIGTWVGITTGGKAGKYIPTYCVIKGDDTFEAYFDRKETWAFSRLATEEEKQKLFAAIKANGYKWNAETKTLEKLIEPKFKVGDKITNGKTSITIGYIDNEYYYEISRNIANRLFIKNQDDWELVPDKFYISTLVPFESRVLVRDADGDLWKPAIYGFSHSKGCYVVGGVYWRQCIPYEENKELLGTTNNPEEYGSR